MSVPFGTSLDARASHKINTTQEIEWTILGSLLAKPELLPEAAILDRGDFNDRLLSDSFNAIRVLVSHHQTVTNLTVAACAAGGVPPERADTYERELGEYLSMVQHDRGYRTGLTAEVKLLRKHRLNRDRKAAAEHDDWLAVNRIGDDILALDKPAESPSMTAAELWAKEFVELRWLVEGVLPEGVTLLVSPPKVGKTRFATQLAIAVASGGYALSYPNLRAEQVGVLYLALESGDRRAQKDLKQLSESPPEGLYFASSWARLSEGGAADLERWLDAHPHVKVIVLDTLAKVRDRGHGGKGFLYSLDYDVGAAIKSIADKRGISVLILHHTNKMVDHGGDMLDCISGSTGVTGSVDHILIIKRERLQADGLLTLISRDYQDRAWAVRFESGLWRLVGTPEEAAEEAGWRGDGESEARQQILDLLRQQGAADPKDIADKLGKNGGAIRRLLMKLVDSGKVVRRMDGKYVSNSGNSGNSGNTGNTGNSGNSIIKSMAVTGTASGNSSGNSEISNQTIDKAIENSFSSVTVTAVTAVTGILESSHGQLLNDCDAVSAVSAVSAPAIVAMMEPRIARQAGQSGT